MQTKILKIDKNTKLEYYHLKGSKPGKKVLCVAGIHGGENTAILVATQLAKKLSKIKLSGTIDIFPIINVPGLLAQARNNPIDNKNISAAGTHNGRKPKNYTISDKIADMVISLAKDCSFFLDLHSGSEGRYIQHVYYMEEKDINWARKLGMSFAIQSNPSNKTKTKNAESITSRVRSKWKIPSLGLELGAGIKVYSEDIIKGMDGILNLLGELKIFKIKKSLPKIRKEKVFRKQRNEIFKKITSPKSGLIIFKKKLGEQVRKNELVAQIIKPSNQTQFDLKAPFNGQLIYQRIPVYLPKEEINKSTVYILSKD